MTLIARRLQGLSYKDAVAQLTFFNKQKVGRWLLRAVHSARFNAEYTYGLNPDRLILARVLAHRSTPVKRIEYKGRMHTGRIEKPRTWVKIIMREIPLVPGEGRGPGKKLQ